MSKHNYLISQLTPEDSEFVSFLHGRQGESQVVSTNGKPSNHIDTIRKYRSQMCSFSQLYVAAMHFLL